MNRKPVRDALQAHFDIDARRLEFIIALLKVRSVNLAQPLRVVLQASNEFSDPSHDERYFKPNRNAPQTDERGKICARAVR